MWIGSRWCWRLCSPKRGLSFPMPQTPGLDLGLCRSCSEEGKYTQNSRATLGFALTNQIWRELSCAIFRCGLPCYSFLFPEIAVTQGLHSHGWFARAHRVHKKFVLVVENRWDLRGCLRMQPCLMRTQRHALLPLSGCRENQMQPHNWKLLSQCETSTCSVQYFLNMNSISSTRVPETQENSKLHCLW